MTISPGVLDFVERTGGVHVDLPSDSNGLGVARMLVHTLAQRRDLDDERTEDLVLAASEAVTEAMEHGETVVLRWHEAPDRCVVAVISEGEAAFLAPPADIPTDPGRAAVEGELRLPLIRALVDEVGVEGSSLTLTIKCDPWEERDG
ncbi:MAG TPA: ATP-binding protein [Acidimicrobiales bacterium]|nr:ATP-binding protein [Acidimicrobiales bacterium]